MNVEIIVKCDICGKKQRKNEEFKKALQNDLCKECYDESIK